MSANRPPAVAALPIFGKVFHEIPSVAAGSGARNEKDVSTPLDVKPGDRVLFGKWSGTEIKIDGEELIIMNGSDIMGIIEQTSSKKKVA